MATKLSIRPHINHHVMVFKAFHPEVYYTHTINNNVQSKTTVILYVIYWPRATCFDSLGIIIRPSLKKIQIHYTELLKHVMGSQMFTIHISLFSYYSIWISRSNNKKTKIYIANINLLWTFGIPYRVLIVQCNGSIFFREGLMMIPRESKHVARGQ